MTIVRNCSHFFIWPLRHAQRDCPLSFSHCHSARPSEPRPWPGHKRPTAAQRPLQRLLIMRWIALQSCHDQDRRSGDARWIAHDPQRAEPTELLRHSGADVAAATAIDQTRRNQERSRLVRPWRRSPQVRAAVAKGGAPSRSISALLPPWRRAPITYPAA